MSNLYISDLFESVVMMDVLICVGSTENNYFENEAKRLLQRSGKGFSFLSFFLNFRSIVDIIRLNLYFKTSLLSFFLPYFSLFYTSFILIFLSILLLSVNTMHTLKTVCLVLSHLFSMLWL